MNLSRAIASSIPTSKRSLLRALSLFQSSNLSTVATPKRRRQPATKTVTDDAEPAASPAPESSPPGPVKWPRAAQISPTTDPVQWPRPAEIPWQPKVANSVHLIGSIVSPVQLDVAPDGVYWAFSVLQQEKMGEFPQLCIPIVFEGDLAQIAACHLKENELVYITGQISGEPPLLTTERMKSSIQVVVHNLSYVQKSWITKNETGSSLSGSTPKNVENEEKLWEDLLANPEDWRDYRFDKKNGLVKPRFPDFKHKTTGRSLWLSSAPKWVQSELEGVRFDVNQSCPKQESDKLTLPTKISDDGKSTEQDPGAKMIIHKENKSKSPPKISSASEKVETSWKDLLANPGNWWDNRSDKFNPKSPDFKHKVTGEALWIGSSSTPTWVQPNLPPLKSKVR